jgi:large subunit ribosomal protein L10
LAITREKKEELVERYKGLIEDSTAIVFADYRGANVAQLRSLRVKMREVGSECIVVKNTLFGIALQQVGRVRPDALLHGTNAVVFLGEDVGEGVKALKAWIRDAKIIEIRGALLEQSVLDGEGAAALSDLPSKEEMRAKLLGTILAPAGSLVRMINAPSASLARVINAHAEKQQEAA